MIDYSQSKAKIRDIMLLHKGRGNPIPRAELVRQVGWDDRIVRTLIAELREEELVPIVGANTAPFGYFLAQTPDELDQAIDTCYSYIASFRKDIEAFNKVKAAMQTDQMSLFEVGKENLRKIREGQHGKANPPA